MKLHLDILYKPNRGSIPLLEEVWIRLIPKLYLEKRLSEQSFCTMVRAASGIENYRVLICYWYDFGTYASFFEVYLQRLFDLEKCFRIQVIPSHATLQHDEPVF